MKMSNVIRTFMALFAGRQKIQEIPKVHTREYKLNDLPGLGTGRQRSHRARKVKTLYKSAVCGFPRTMTRPGSIPAPTLDQVRFLERSMGVRLHVRSFQGQGRIFIRDTGEMLPQTF